MNEQTIKLIEQLATKLGTTAEHLWLVLVRQAPISATIDLGLTIVAGLFIALSVKTVLVAIKKLDENYEHDDELKICSIIAASVVGLITTIIFIGLMFHLDVTIAGFLNPEFWALKQIVP